MRRTWIDFDLATSDLSDNAFRVMVYLRLHADKSGNCWPSLPKIAIETGRSERSVDFAIRELKSKQFLQSFNQGRGRYQFQIIERTSATSCAGKESEQAQKTTETSATHCAGKQETGAKSEVNERKKCTERAQKVGGRSHIREQCIEQGIEQSSSKSESEPGQSEVAAADLEPFESGLGTNLPDFKPAQRIETRKVQFQHAQLGEIDSDFKKILGISAETIIRRIDQEMVDSGFVRWALQKSEPKDTPPAFFQHLINTEWADGRWQDPEIGREQKARQKAADQAREKLAEELTRARNLMEMAKREFAKGAASMADVQKYTEKFEEISRRAEAC